jgi:hypothetical protein
LLGGLGIALRERSEALRNGRAATAFELTAYASQAPLDDPRRALILAAYAVEKTVNHKEPMVRGAEEALRSALLSRLLFVKRVEYAEAAAFSADGRTIAIFAHGYLFLFDVASGAAVGLLQTSGVDHAAAISFSPDGSYVLLAGDGTWRDWENGSPTVWNLKSGGRAVDLSGALAATFSHDGGQILAVRRDRRIETWDLASKRLLSLSLPLGVLADHIKPLFDRAFFAPGGQRLVTGEHHLDKSFSRKIAIASGDYRIRAIPNFTLWDGRGRKLAGFPAALDAIIFSPDGTLMAASYFGGQVDFLMADGTTWLTAFKGERPAFSAGSAWLLVDSLRGTTSFGTTSVWRLPAADKFAANTSGVLAWSTLESVPQATLELNHGLATAFAIDPAGDRLFAAYHDGAIALWDLERVPDLSHVDAAALLHLAHSRIRERRLALTPEECRSYLHAPACPPLP